MRSNFRKRVLIVACALAASAAFTACDDSEDNPPVDNDATDGVDGTDGVDVETDGEIDGDGETDGEVDGDGEDDGETTPPPKCTYDDVETCLNRPIACDPAAYAGKTKDDYIWPDEVAGNGVDSCDHYALPDCDGLTGLLDFVNTSVTDGSTICFTDAEYVFTRSLSLPKNSGVTLVGMGDGYDVEGMFPDDGSWDRTNPEKLPAQGSTDAEGYTRLNFSNLQKYNRKDGGACKVEGSTQGIVTQPGVEDITFQDFAVIDTLGDAIETSEIKNVTFRGVTTQWTAAQCVENGAYGIYPVKSAGVIVEYSVVEGAADAGIYVGQSDQVLVRRSVAFNSVAGIEIENTTSAEVTEMYAYDNTGGMLIFNLPGIIKQGYGTKLHNNNFSENNLNNFADPNTSVGNVPAGTGIMILANDYNDVFDNHLVDNGFTGVLIVHYSDILGKPDSEAYNVLSERNCVRDNVIGYTQAKDDIVVGTSNNGPLIRNELWTVARGVPEVDGQKAPLPDLVEGGCEASRPADHGVENPGDLAIWTRDDVCPYYIGGMFDFMHIFTQATPCAPVINPSDVVAEDDSPTEFEINHYHNNVDLSGDPSTFGDVHLCSRLDNLTTPENDLGVDLELGERAQECNFDLPCQTGRYGVACAETEPSSL